MTMRLLSASLAVLALSACASLPEPAPAPVAVRIIALNDFHGALLPATQETRFAGQNGPQSALLGGAARLGATIARLRAEQPDSLVVAAGDLIGASPVISQQFLDEPAIAALSLAGLDVASVGNHEFDRGIAELRRMQDGGCEAYTSRKPCALEPFAGASFRYLAGNITDADGATLFPGTALREVGGAKIGFIGLTLKDTPQLVSSSAIAGYSFGDEAEAANRLAAGLKAEGADAVVLLIHEGAQVDPTLNVSGCPGLSGAIVPILERLDPAIGLVVSGHTHQAYSCKVGGRTLTSAGRYGGFVTQIDMAIDPASDTVLSLSAHNVPVTQEAGEDPAIAALVARYVAASEAIAERPVGSWQLVEGGDETCLDSPADRLVADAQLAATRDLEGGPADIAFLNSGGVRTDLPPGASGTMTYGDALAMQPFANSVLVVEMPGSAIKAVLEEQFCEAADGTVATCHSALLPSQGFAYSFDRSQPAGERIVSVTLNGKPLDPAKTYRVAINNFLAEGGDGFATFTRFSVIDDAGIDVDALETWLAPGASIPPCGRIRDLSRQP
ncbi:bifunctional metallophosphatase/5'-nucleotidase [Aurantiacibacter suaedae]|uniref:bifunctional metallophosphatase/5'-nucleotidase n=1 Tax=Aurantiacibacter suaedae TaxID=2545755 RepID=UPI001386FED9|nr:bifunctional UDP-sugar hydrolase/5'-nucleotidase [Aurantiacibacter suaedae]